MSDLARRLLAEWLGTAFLLAVVVGSGIMGERLSGGNVALALLANAVATGCALVALIVAMAPVSGAHFNPAVSLAMAARGALSWGHAGGYTLAQVAGAFAGVAAAHTMFDLPLFTLSEQPRLGLALTWSEFVATFGLLLIILATARQTVVMTALAVGTYITAGYWFTASTSFANPAVSIARAFTDSFSGIRFDGVPCFVAAQITAAFCAVGMERILFTPPLKSPAGNVGEQAQAQARDGTAFRAR